LFSGKAAIFWRVSTGGLSGQPRGVFGGEGDGRLGGDGEEKIKRASEETSVRRALGLALIPPSATPCLGGRPARSCRLRIPGFPSFPTAGPKLKSARLGSHRSDDSDLPTLTRVNVGHPVGFLGEKGTAG